MLQTILGPSVSSTPPTTINNYQGGMPTDLCTEVPQFSRPLLDSPRKRRRLDDCDDRLADLTWSTGGVPSDTLQEWLPHDMAPPSSGTPTLESILSRPTTPELVSSLTPVLQDVLNPPIGPTPPATMNDYQRGLSADPTPLRSPPDAPHRRRRLDGCDGRLADHTDDALVSPDSTYETRTIDTREGNDGDDSSEGSTNGSIDDYYTPLLDP